MQFSSGTRFFIAAAWTLCLILSSVQPMRPGPVRSGTFTHLVAHVLAFGFTAFLWQLGSARLIWSWTAAIGIFWLAVVIELTQHRMYRNRFEWEDLLADALGLLMATLPRVMPRTVRNTA
jgi:hypothetical protein